MQIVYFSLTGNIKRFLQKAQISDAIEISPDLEMNQDYILITSTINFGEVPKDVINFLKKPINRDHIKGVVGSGNRNWGILYCKAAKDLAKVLNVPNSMNFELAGTVHEVQQFKEILNDFAKE